MVDDGRNADTVLVEGIHIDGSSTGVVNVEKSDLKVMPDSHLLQTVPLPGSSAEHHRFCRIYFVVDGEGNPHPMDPRNLLKYQVEKSAFKGL